MKKIIYSLLACLTLVFVFVSCNDKTSYDDSKITYYVTFAMNGDQTMYVPVGTTYTDPGVKAMEGDKDVTSTMKTTGTVNANEVGLYPVTYSAINADGYPNSVTRTVFVYDPSITVDISGNYQVDAAASYRIQLSNNAKIKYSDMKTIYGKGDFSKFIVKLAQIKPGLFSVSDLFGGYYSDGRGYGSDYEMTGYLSLSSNNSIQMLYSHVIAWGDSMDDLKNGTYDPTTGIIKWSAYYTNTYSFNVALNKK